MKLGEIIGPDLLNANPQLANNLSETGISGLTADSRTIEPGWLFAALPGTQQDGRAFIADALDKGAAAILTLAGSDLDPAFAQERIVFADNPRKALALMAARFYHAQPDVVAGVTGTNGKTSVANFAQQIWEHLGLGAASMGTLGIQGTGIDRPGSLTTPDPVALHRELAALEEAGISHLAIEASSHGLDQYRLDGIRFAGAAFTNLSRDHMDYHASMKDYMAAKRRLFTELLHPDGTAVINADAAEGQALIEAARSRGCAILPYGERAPDAGLRLIRVSARRDGLSFSFSHAGRRYDADLPLIGTYQAMNALCALGLVIGAGVNADKAVGALARLRGAPGRLQMAARHPNGAPIYVDYAHTPDALAAVLQAVRPHTGGRLAVVFGCGGDRDPGKRPLMGQSAREHADIVYLTDDNPRTEDAAAIRREAHAGCPAATEIGDRREAIETAIAALEPGDVLVIAGKGHEQGQIVGDTVLPFDDVEVARKAARKTGNAA